MPLPTPLLADLINASFPRLWAHTALLRRTLWSTESVPLPRVAGQGASAARSTLSGVAATLRELVLPLSVRSYFSPAVQPRSAESKSAASSTGGTDARAKPAKTPATALSKKDRDFARKRQAFFAVCAVGLLGWGFGTGAFPVPFAGRWARLLGEQQQRRKSGGGGMGWIRFAAGAGEEGGYDEDEDEDGEWEEEDEEDEEDEFDEED